MKLNGSFCLNFKADDLLRYEYILVYILYIYIYILEKYIAFLVVWSFRGKK